MARRALPNPPATNLNALNSMRGNRGRDTSPELAVRAALRGLGVRGYRVSARGIPGRPDIAFTRWKLAVFVHGCFWHRCPHCSLELPKANRPFWRRKFELNAERDERKRRQLEATGWEVLEIWECEANRDAVSCASRVKRAIERIQLHLEADEDRAELRAVPRTKRSMRGRA
jgi:DNA mismatch endonuclease, patch repair protein